MDIRAALNPEMLTKYQEFTFNEAMSTIKGLTWCPTAGCGYAFSHEGVENFACPKCQKNYCLKCLSLEHRG